MRRLPLLCLSTAVTVGLLEGLLALVDVSVPRPRFYPGEIVPATPGPSVDPLVGWKLPPSDELVETTADYTVTYRSNSLGFRSTREFEIRPDEERVAILGDSYTFGSGVEDNQTFSALLEHEFAGTVFYNFGIGAFGVDQMLLTLVHYALPLKPRVVIVCFIRNDLERSMTAYRKDRVWRSKPTFTLVGGRLERLTRENAPSAAWRLFQRKSRIHGLLRKAEIELSRRYAIGPQWRLNRALFERIRDECEQSGAALLVVHIPVNRRLPAPMFAGEFAAMEIEYLDLNPYLPADADSLYYPTDRHFNPEGHRFMAQAIRVALESRGLLRIERP